MIDALRNLLDDLAAAQIDEADARSVHDAIAILSARLAPMAVEERRQSFGRLFGVPGHGQVLCPAFVVDAQDATSVAAHVTFGRFHLGGNGAVHGGAISLIFDEVLGIPANVGVARMARTAYLHVNYRAIAPIGVRLEVTARTQSIDGRKRLVRGELRHGDRLCADAEGLFLELRPGQP